MSIFTTEVLRVSMQLYFQLYEYVSSYFLEIVILSCLSIMTIFRREMSCNSVYTDSDGDASSMLYSVHSISLTNILKYGNDKLNSSIMQNPGNSCPILELPNDIQIKCFSYLHPRDILTFSCSDRQTNDMIHNENKNDARRQLQKSRQWDKGGRKETEGRCQHGEGGKDAGTSLSCLLWYTLFLRDYAQLLTLWHAGIDAVEKSKSSSSVGRASSQCSAILNWGCPDKIVALLLKKDELQRIRSHCIAETLKITRPSMKEFYLVFSQTWLEYCIAGRTQSPTLVGIHGHVFDMTSFLDEHPGSPETIIMQGGGRDASSFFETVGHSGNARRLAMERLVEVVDISCCRTERRKHSEFIQGSNGIRLTTDPGSKESFRSTNVLPKKRSEKRRLPGTLHHIRNLTTKDKSRAKTEARRTVTRQMSKVGEMDILGHVNIYFDPLCYCWKGWYLNLDFEPVFVHKIRSK
mmetsp:Transcript_18091/g.26586  ORF Transcript_18091/g.26586 Transcript_18091/m.26586 type:complete len:464 (+) Transcript_18091:85-1476(+)